jgi:hypothetical protein
MIHTALRLVRDGLHFVALIWSSRNRLAAENLFLGKQPAFYVERKVKPRRLNDARPARLEHARTERSEGRRVLKCGGSNNVNEVDVVRPARLERATSWFVAGRKGGNMGQRETAALRFS